MPGTILGGGWKYKVRDEFHSSKECASRNGGTNIAFHLNKIT